MAPLVNGLLVYFGYPDAHEDDAQQAVRMGLEIVEALQQQVRKRSTDIDTKEIGHRKISLRFMLSLFVKGVTTSSVHAVFLINAW